MTGNFHPSRSKTIMTTTIGHGIATKSDQKKDKSHSSRKHGHTPCGEPSNSLDDNHELKITPMTKEHCSNSSCDHQYQNHYSNNAMNSRDTPIWDV